MALDGFRTNRASSRLILLALASLGPKYIDGTPIDLAAILEKHGVKAVTEFLPGRSAHAANRGFWQSGRSSVDSGVDVSVLQSHLISSKMVEPLVNDEGWFIQLRARALEQLMREFLFNKLEVNALVRPPLRDLIATGNAEDD